MTQNYDYSTFGKLNAWHSFLEESWETSIQNRVTSSLRQDIYITHKIEEYVLETLEKL